MDIETESVQEIIKDSIFELHDIKDVMLKSVIIAINRQDINIPIATKIPPTINSQPVTLLIADTQNMARIKLPDIGSLSMLSEHIADRDIVDNAFLAVELEGCLNVQKDIVDKELYIETFEKYSNDYFDC